MKSLRSRLYQMQLEEQAAAIAGDRKSQIGSGSRSEKIRTYNWKDNRCTDHRLGQNVPLQQILSGNFNELIQQFSKLPGLGPKSAKRIILKLINNKDNMVKP